ncbi:MAG: hypothetical protein ACREH4_07735 [Vitreimonas sp.]
MEKLIAQKPVVWNAHGYMRPAGSRSVKGFVTDTGYGAEEWNGNPERIWQGQRVFHTQSKRRMDEYGRDGRLAIVMTAYHDGRPYVVGAAVAVTRNTTEEMRDIARVLRIKREADRMWREVQAIRDAFGSRSRFERHWTSRHDHMPWRANPENYVWFQEPIPVDVHRVFAGTRNDIAKMHSACMYIRPDQAAAMLARSVPANSPVLEWFTSGDYSRGLKGTSNSTAPPARKVAPSKPSRRTDGTRGTSAPSASHAFVRYMKEHEVRVTPRHSQLQKRFCAHISLCNPIEDLRRVDVRFVDPRRGLVLAEVKPCTASDARYAIRMAMGQLLDYQQYEPPARLMIALETEPASDADVSLATSNGFGIAWPKRSKWMIRWPDDAN